MQLPVLSRGRAGKARQARIEAVAGGLLLALFALVLFAPPGCKEPVRNAPPMSQITLSAEPLTIATQGGESVIRAVVRLATGELVPDDVIVNFFTTLGAIESEARTQSGVARATLRSTGTPGTAVVSALSGAAAVATIEVVIGITADQVRVTLDPSSLADGGGSAAVTAQVTDATGAPLAGRLVTLSATSPGILDSAGRQLTTDDLGLVRDTVRTTATTTITAALAGSSLTGQATLTVGASTVSSVVLIAQPQTLPSGGGTAELTAFLTGASGEPLPGVTVTFDATGGSLSPAVDATDQDGIARSALDTTVTSVVTADAEGVTGSATVTVGGGGTVSYQVALSAPRTAVGDVTLTLGLACQSPGPNPQLPLLVIAQVTDLAGQSVDGIDVTLTVDQSSGGATAGRGGFCDGAAVPASCCGAPASCPTCSDRLACATPTPVPVPPAPPACCNAGALPKTRTGRSGTAGPGRLEVTFSFEDTDICECVYRGARCTATIRASAPFAQAVNNLVLTLGR